MILSCHTPAGIIDIDSDIATDTDLAKIGLTRAQMLKMAEPEEAKKRAIQAIIANSNTPWGRVLYDMALAIKLIEPP